MKSLFDVSRITAANCKALTSFWDNIDDHKVNTETAQEKVFFFSVAKNVLRYISSEVILDMSQYKSLHEEDADNYSTQSAHAHNVINWDDIHVHVRSLKV